MKKYVKPVIDLLLFDEEEILTASGDQPTTEVGVHSMYQLNDFFFEKDITDATTTIKLQDIQVQ